MTIEKLKLNKGDKITLDAVKKALNQPEAIEQAVQDLIKLRAPLTKTTPEEFLLQRIIRAVCGERVRGGNDPDANDTLNTVRGVAGVPDNNRVLHEFLKLKEKAAEATAAAKQAAASAPTAASVTPPAPPSSTSTDTMLVKENQMNSILETMDNSWACPQRPTQTEGYFWGRKTVPVSDQAYDTIVADAAVKHFDKIIEAVRAYNRTLYSDDTLVVNPTLKLDKRVLKDETLKISATNTINNYIQKSQKFTLTDAQLKKVNETINKKFGLTKDSLKQKTTPAAPEAAAPQPTQPAAASAAPQAPAAPAATPPPPEPQSNALIRALAPDENEDAGLFPEPEAHHHPAFRGGISEELTESIHPASMKPEDTHPASRSGIEISEDQLTEENIHPASKKSEQQPAEAKPAESPTAEKPAAQAPKPAASAEPPVNPANLIAGFAAESPGEEAQLKAAAHAALHSTTTSAAAASAEEPPAVTLHVGGGETPASTPAPAVEKPGQTTAVPPVQPPPASEPATKAPEPTTATAPKEPEPAPKESEPGPTRRILPPKKPLVLPPASKEVPAYVSGEMIDIVKALSKYAEAKLPKDKKTGDPMHQDAQGKKPILRGSYGGILSNKANKEAIAQDAEALLKSNSSNIVKLWNLRALMRSNKAATGFQLHSGDLTKILAKAEAFVKAEMTPRERGIAELKDYLVIAEETKQRDNLKLPFKTDQKTKLDEAMHVLEKLEKNRSMPEEEFKELLEGAIKVNDKATHTLRGKGKLHEIYQNLLDNTTPEARKAPKATK